MAAELEDIFRNSLKECSSASESSVLWKASNAREKAKRFLDLNSQAASAFLQERSQVAVINEPTLVHMFWLLDVDGGSVLEYVDLLLHEVISRSFPHTKFWSAYSRAIAVFSGMTVASFTKPKLVGYEKYWSPYLDFMAGNISADDFTSQAASSFTTRNRQLKSIDWLSLDGDGKNQVKWDLRYAAIKQKLPGN